MRYGGCSVVVAIAVTAVIAGCGDAQTSTTATSTTAADTSTTATAATAPQPRTPIAARVSLLERALADGACEDAVAVLHPALLPEPAQLGAPANCASARSRLATLKGFEFSDSQEFGPVAIVDGEIDGAPTDLVFVIDADRELKWISATVPTHEVGTEPIVGDHPEAPAIALADALRAGDCKGAYKQIAPGGRLDYGSENAFCKQFAATFTAEAEGFGSRLEADPAARPVELVATRNWSFYGVATEPAGYRVLVVGFVGNKPKVFHIDPVER